MLILLYMQTCYLTNFYILIRLFSSLAWLKDPLKGCLCFHHLRRDCEDLLFAILFVAQIFHGWLLSMAFQPSIHPCVREILSAGWASWLLKHFEIQIAFNHLSHSCFHTYIYGMVSYCELVLATPESCYLIKVQCGTDVSSSVPISTDGNLKIVKADF